MGGIHTLSHARTLEDLNSFFELNLQEDLFPDRNATHWRIGLLLYSHIVEMDAPYEVLTNLLRFRLGKGYSSFAFLEFLTDKEKRSFRKRGIPTSRKIKIIQSCPPRPAFPRSEQFSTTSTTTTFATPSDIPTTS